VEREDAVPPRQRRRRFRGSLDWGCVLTLTREVGQQIYIGDDIVLTVVSVSMNGRVRLGIEAPKQVRIDRKEVLERIRQENVDSANAIPEGTVDAAAWASYGARRANARAKPQG
jgi:carbon storage regulator